MSTTRQRLFRNMAPLILGLFVVFVVACLIACWVGLFVSAQRGDTAWCIFWATVILSGAVSVKGDKS